MSKWRRFAGIYTAPSRELIYGTKYAENVYVRTLALLPYAVDVRWTSRTTRIC